MFRYYQENAWETFCEKLYHSLFPLVSRVTLTSPRCQKISWVLIFVDHNFCHYVKISIYFKLTKSSSEGLLSSTCEKYQRCENSFSEKRQMEIWFERLCYSLLFKLLNIPFTTKSSRIIALRVFSFAMINIK